MVSHLNLLYGAQLQSGDLLFRAANLQQKTELEDKIAIVAIDDKSLEELGHFSSWPRSYHSQVIDRLAEAGAGIIVFDILFSESTPDDRQLAASINRAGNVILPLVCTFTVQKSTVTRKTIVSGTAIKPSSTLEENVLALGHANMLTGEDGIVRRLPLVILNGDHYEPALALTTVAKYLRRSQVIESPLEDNSLPFVGRAISLDDANSMLINYTDDAAVPLNFEKISYVDVMKKNVDLSTLRDKILIVDVTAVGLGDTFWTPMGQMKSGVELHASAINTIMTANFLKSAPSWVTVASILILALLCGLAALRLRVLWSTLSVCFLVVIYFLTAFFFFDNGVMLNMLYPPPTIAGTFVGVNVYNTTSARAEKSEVTRTFGRCVSPSVVNKILAVSEEGELKLGGEEHEVTVLFADVRSFTNISEKVPPQELVGVLNSYLSVIIKSVTRYEGMINKFGGDSLMAVWNAPVECEEHALLAAKAAVEAQYALAELQQETTLPKMKFGIGVNTGEVVAGNMGSRDRMEYSVIGDAVNIAARLAGAAPGGKVWIGAETFGQAMDYIKAEPLQPLTLKGKHQPIQAYEVLAIENRQTMDRQVYPRNP
ncbi:CHASE2 domain-containing protein [Chloroflexota bacterium]